MKASANPQVQDFLEDMMTSDEMKFDILQGLREIVLTQKPEVSERIIYGGIMFSTENDIGGIFASKKHVSFEFGNGSQFDDPDNLLEGTGKFRRHLKISTMQDIQDKKVDFFVQQAI